MVEASNGTRDAEWTEPSWYLCLSQTTLGFLCWFQLYFMTSGDISCIVACCSFVFYLFTRFHWNSSLFSLLCSLSACALTSFRIELFLLSIQRKFNCVVGKIFYVHKLNARLCIFCNTILPTEAFNWRCYLSTDSKPQRRSLNILYIVKYEYMESRKWTAFVVCQIQGNRDFFFLSPFIKLKDGPGATGRVLPSVTGRSWVRVAVSLHCTGEGKTCDWHPSPDPAQSGSSLHWVRPFFLITKMCSSPLCLRFLLCYLCLY